MRALTKTIWGAGEKRGQCCGREDVLKILGCLLCWCSRIGIAHRARRGVRQSWGGKKKKVTAKRCWGGGEERKHRGGGLGGELGRDGINSLVKCVTKHEEKGCDSLGTG